MQELIRVTTNDQGEQVVSARDLHEYLEVKDHFTQWADRMFEYGFTQGVDYQAINQIVKHLNGVGSSNKTDYVLTLDCAKEISMIQRTEKGKQARQYFIECEKVALNLKMNSAMQLPSYQIQDEIERAYAWAEERKVLRLAESNVKYLQIELDKSNEWYSIKKVASINKVHWKSLEYKRLKHIGMGMGYEPKKIFDANFPSGVNAYHIEVWRVAYPNFKY